MEREEHIPIIALTAHALKEDMAKLLAQGFDGYESKPLEIRVLNEEVMRLAVVRGACNSGLESRIAGDICL